MWIPFTDVINGLLASNIRNSVKYDHCLCQFTWEDNVKAYVKVFYVALVSLEGAETKPYFE